MSGLFLWAVAAAKPGAQRSLASRQQARNLVLFFADDRHGLKLLSNDEHELGTNTKN